MAMTHYCWTVLMSLLISGYSEDVLGPPTNVRFIVVNINSTLIWDPPEIVSDGDVILYTAKYQRCGSEHVMDKPECTRITSTRCNFGADFFPSEKLWCAVVESISEQFNTTSQSVTKSTYPRVAGVIGRPDMTTMIIGSSYIYISWLAPQTPYTYPINGEVKRVNNFMRVDYNLTYWETNNKDVKVTTSQQTKLNLNLTDLQPATSYDIVIQGQINEVYGIPLKINAATEETAPGVGVDRVIVNVQSPDCYTSSDLNNVNIEWSPIDEEDHNGVLTRYEVHYSYSNTTLQIQNITDVNATSTLLTDLYRWEQYYITVSVCTSAGCTEHKGAPYVLEPDKVGLDPPGHILAEYTSTSSFNVSWIPPDNDECIIGYHVTYNNNRSSIYNMFVRDDLYVHITDVPASYYMVYVSAVIYSDFNSSVNGSHAVTGINIRVATNSSKLYLIAVVPGIIVLICVLVLIYQCKRDAVKTIFANPLPRKQWKIYVTTLSMKESIPVYREEPNEEEYDAPRFLQNTPRQTSSSSSSNLSELIRNTNTVNGNDGIEIVSEVEQMIAAGTDESAIIKTSPSMNSDNYVHRRDQLSSPALGRSHTLTHGQLCDSSLNSSFDENESDLENTIDLNRFLNESLNDISDVNQGGQQHFTGHGPELLNTSDDGGISDIANSNTPSNLFSYSKVTEAGDGYSLF
uniref:Uncharacterized protein LOC102804742 n=1 Tax=Saccoglossus kowalevskii TaxID=10224 RepID=A0ABM0MCK9_SACKO|nr:PREDICTED: uncharacterized protein LOC102804742 [Saccoglossus kowalevskii]